MCCAATTAIANSHRVVDFSEGQWTNVRTGKSPISSIGIPVLDSETINSEDDEPKNGYQNFAVPLIVAPCVGYARAVPRQDSTVTLTGNVT